MLAEGLIKQSKAIEASQPIIIESESKLEALRESYEQKLRSQREHYEQELNTQRHDMNKLRTDVSKLRLEKKESQKEIKVSNKETESILAEELSKHQKALRAFRQIAEENATKMETLRVNYEQEIEAHRQEIRVLRQDKEAREQEMKTKKENMEKAIARQLKKADKLLVKAKGVCDGDDRTVNATTRQHRTDVKMANIKSTQSLVQNVFH